MSLNRASKFKLPFKTVKCEFCEKEENVPRLESTWPFCPRCEIGILHSINHGTLQIRYSGLYLKYKISTEKLFLLDNMGISSLKMGIVNGWPYWECHCGRTNPSNVRFCRDCNHSKNYPLNMVEPNYEY